MKTAMSDTSLDAYRAHSVRALSAGQRRVMDVIRPGVDFTRAEIAHASGQPINVVCPRVRELLDCGRLEEGPRRICSRTGGGANPVRLPSKQLELLT
jgi:hypothetical protein